MRTVNLASRRNQAAQGPGNGPTRINLAVAALILIAWGAAGIVRAGRAAAAAAMPEAVVAARATSSQCVVSWAQELADARNQSELSATRREAEVPVAALSLVSTLVPEGVDIEELELSLSREDAGRSQKAWAREGPFLGPRMQLRGSSADGSATVSLLKQLTESEFLRNVRAEEKRSVSGETARTEFKIGMDLVPPGVPPRGDQK